MLICLMTNCLPRKSGLDEQVERSGANSMDGDGQGQWTQSDVRHTDRWNGGRGGAGLTGRDWERCAGAVRCPSVRPSVGRLRTTSTSPLLDECNCTPMHSTRLHSTSPLRLPVVSPAVCACIRLPSVSPVVSPLLIDALSQMTNAEVTPSNGARDFVVCDVALGGPRTRRRRRRRIR